MVVCNATLACRVAEDPALQSLYDAAWEDDDYQAILDVFQRGIHLNNLPPSHPARLLRNYWDDISVFDEALLVYNDQRIFVPKSLRPSFLSKLHESHSGISKTKSLARQYFFWPGITKDIENLISNCVDCRLHRPSQSDNLQSHEPASYPMQAVGMDLFSLQGKTYLVMVDRFSDYLWVSPLNRTSTSDVVSKITSWFLEFGFPATIMSDNGPQFRSDFQTFCADNNIVHSTSSPYNPQSNGLAESAVKAAKTLLLKSDSWSDFQTKLQAWRNVPSAGSNASPSEKFFGRRQRHGLPSIQLTPLTSTPKAGEITRLKPFQIGDKVFLQNVFNKEWDETGIVTEIRPSGLSYEITKDSDGKTISRNRKFLLELNNANSKSRPTPQAQTQAQVQDEHSVTTRRSSRIKNPVLRFSATG